MSFRRGCLPLNLLLILFYLQLSVYTAEGLSCYKCSDFIRGPCFHPEKEHVLVETCTLTDVPSDLESELRRHFRCFYQRLYYHESGPVIYRGCVDDGNFCNRSEIRRVDGDIENEAEPFRECEICEEDLCNSVPHKNIGRNGLIPFLSIAFLLINFN